MAGWARKYKATPTLRGLVIEQEQSGNEPPSRTLHPWTCVTRSVADGRTSCWIPHEDNRQKVNEGGRGIQLSVSGYRANEIARRAHTRAFKRALQCGELVLRERYSHNRTWDWIGMALLTVLVLTLVVLCGHAFSRTWPEDPLAPLPMGYRIMAWLLLLTSLFGLGALSGLGLLIVFRLVTQTNVVSARFDHQGVQATLRNGDEVRADWASIEDIKPTAHPAELRFRDNLILRFKQLNSQTRLLLDVIQDEYLHEAAATRRRSERQLPIRIGLYWVAGALVGAILAWRFVPYGQGLSWPAVPAMFLLLGAVCCGFVVWPKWVQKVQRAMKKHRNRLRAGAQPQSTSRHDRH